MNIQIHIADLAEELADPRQHREERWGWSAARHRIRLQDHIVIQDGLLAQLHEAVASAMDKTDRAGGSRSASRSAPPLQLEALACYMEIAASAAQWCDALGVPKRPTVEGNIRALAGASLSGYGEDLLADMRRWRNRAATLTGWQQPLYKPRAECPVVECGRANTLRINLLAKTAVCMACEAYWDSATIGILGAHIAQAVRQPRVPVRSGAAGHGGWASKVAL